MGFFVCWRCFSLQFLFGLTACFAGGYLDLNGCIVLEISLFMKVFN